MLATHGVGTFLAVAFCIGMGLAALFIIGCLLGLVLFVYLVYVVLRDTWREKHWSPEQHAQDVIREVTRNVQKQMEKEKNEHLSNGTPHRKARRR